MNFRPLGFIDRGLFRLSQWFHGIASYGAARRDRTTADWRSGNQSADQAHLMDEPTIRARARMAKRDDWLGASIGSAERRDVVHVGIWPRADSRLPDGEPRLDFNKRATKRFKRWANNKDQVDVEGKQTLRQMLALAQDEKRTVGNSFFVWSINRRASAPSLQLQMFEVEQLANDVTCQPDPGNLMRGGIEVTPLGKAVAYWVHTGVHPLEVGGMGLPPTRIPAEQVLHLHRRGRCRETIGVSGLAPVLRKMWDRAGYDENELLAKKKESFLAFAIKTNPAYGDAIPGYNPVTNQVTAPGDLSDKRTGRYREIRFEPGMVPELFDGEELQFFNPSRPGSNYDAYQRRQTGMISAGVGRNPSAITRDYSLGSYGSLRQGELDDNREIDTQQLDIVDTVLHPLYRIFIALEVTEGKLDAPGFFEDEEVAEDFLDVVWQFPPREWLDPAKSAAAAKIQLDERLKSRADLIGQGGGYWGDTLDQINDERKYADALKPKLDFPEDMPFGPPVSPSEPKVHGTGDAPNQIGQAPRTQRAGRGKSERLTSAILAAALREED